MNLDTNEQIFDAFERRRTKRHTEGPTNEQNPKGSTYKWIVDDVKYAIFSMLMVLQLRNTCFNKYMLTLQS